MSSTLKAEISTGDAQNVACPNFSTFNNQISGHSCLLKNSTNSQSILKPFNRAEADFYEFVTKNKQCPVAKFIPAYYGLLTLPKPQLKEIAEDIFRDTTSSEESEDSKSSDEETTEPAEHHTEASAEPRKGTPCPKLQSKAEWTKNLFQTRFDEKNDCFLQIRDLTTDIVAPCILDLKMGSVAYNTEKLKHQAIKLGNSTSASLKFRVCGLQVKNPNTNTEYFRDKYWGRKVRTEAINNALALFFYDGKKIRRNLIKQFINHLKELRDAVKNCKDIKFLSVSLLLVYDGSIEDAQFADDKYAKEFLKDKMKVDLIDFAKSKCGEEINETDEDLLEGIENLMKTLTFIQESSDMIPSLV